MTAPMRPLAVADLDSDWLRQAAADGRATVIILPKLSRLDSRDGAIRDLRRRHFHGLAPSVAARQMADSLSRRILEVDRPTPPTADRTDLNSCLDRVICRNGYKSLGWRQLLNIVDGWRS